MFSDYLSVFCDYGNTQELCPTELFGSSRPEVFFGKGVLKIYSKFTGEHPCVSVISITLVVASEVSPVNLLHINRTPFPRNISGRLLLFKFVFIIWLLFHYSLPIMHQRLSSVRSSHRRYSVRKGVLRNFAKFTKKHLCQSLFFNNVSGWGLFKKRLWHRCFAVNFAKYLRTPFLQKTTGRLLLQWVYWFFITTAN